MKKTRVQQYGKKIIAALLFLSVLSIQGCKDIEEVKEVERPSVSEVKKEETHTFGNKHYNTPQAVAVHNNGNVYIVGDSSNSREGQNENLIFAKFDQNGNKQWQQTFGENEYDQIATIIVDQDENIYLAGNISGATRGYNPLEYRDSFIAKYNSTGKQEWVQYYETTMRNTTNGLTVDGSGNVYLLGTTLGVDDKSRKVEPEFFLVKYDSLGSQQWAHHIPAPINFTDRQLLKTDDFGNIYIAGRVYKEDGSSKRHRTVKLMKFDTDGNHLWSQTPETKKTTLVGGIDIDASGNIYMAGTTESTGFDGHETYAWLHAFVIKYSSTGTKLWSTQFEVENIGTEVKSLTLDDSENIRIIHYYSGDPNLTKLDSNGNIAQRLFCKASSSRHSQYYLSKEDTLYIANAKIDYSETGLKGDIYYQTCDSSDFQQQTTPIIVSPPKQ